MGEGRREGRRYVPRPQVSKSPEQAGF
jgi:hypothetical protein